MTIRIGIGGWDFAGWRGGSFYPTGLPRARELAYASRQLTSIEINATFYRTQTPGSFAAWRAATPEDFVFALKAPRAAAYGRDPDKVAAAISRFLGSGIEALGPKLGPILWQFPAARRFEAAEVARFVSLLPARHEGLVLRHAIEAKHESFADPAFAALLSTHNVAACIVESATQNARLQTTADFLYLRLQRTQADAPEGYASPLLDGWAAWLTQKMTSMQPGVHVYFISGAKQRAPDAARALMTRFGIHPDAVPDRDLRSH